MGMISRAIGAVVQCQCRENQCLDFSPDAQELRTGWLFCFTLQLISLPPEVPPEVACAQVTGQQNLKGVEHTVYHSQVNINLQ